MCILHPLSRPLGCGEVSAHGAVTSSSLVPGLRALSRVRSATGGCSLGMGSDCLWSDPVLGHDSWKKHLWAGNVTDL